MAFGGRFQTSSRSDTELRALIERLESETNLTHRQTQILNMSKEALETRRKETDE